MKSPFPASYHQERLWFIDQFETGNLYPRNPVYHNIPLILDIKGNLEPDTLERSIEEVIRRHEALRTRIVKVDDRPFQRSEATVDFKLERREPENRNSGEEHQLSIVEATELAIQLSRRPLPLDSQSLVRGTLIKRGDQAHLLVVTLHHAVADRYSLEIFLREMLAFYQALRRNGSPVLSQLTAHYADFARFQRELPPRLYKPLWIYWQKQLRGKLLPLELPVDRPRALIHKFREGRLHFALPEDLVQRIRISGRRDEGDTFIRLLAAFKILLYRYSGSEEIVVGTGSRNRGQPGTENIIGPLANLLVLRSRFSGSWGVEKFFRDVERTVRDAFRYQAMPFDRLVTELNPDKDMSRTAFFDVLFQYEESPLRVANLEDLEVRVIETNLGRGKYDLNLLLQNHDRSMEGVVVYNRDYFDESTIVRLVENYQVTLNEVLGDPMRPLSRIPVMTAGEKERLLKEWNRVEGECRYPPETVIQTIFEDRVLKNPQRLALTGVSGQVSYRQLDRLAGDLAGLLRSRRVGEENIIALMMERSPELIAAVLGVLKAGGAYLPIDPGYPENRKQFMLADSGASLWVEAEDMDLTLRETSPDNFVKTKSVPPAGKGRQSRHLAYVIYTSGTTGRPKGVMVEHRQVIRLFFSDGCGFDFDSRDVWTLFHSYCFDFSVWEMYGALLFGGRLVVISGMSARDTHRYLEILRKEQVTVLNQTPSAFYRLQEEELSHHRREPALSLRYIIFGGEALHPGKLNSWSRHYPHTRLVNMFGITETTVHVTCKEMTAAAIEAGVSNIGRPIPTLTTYVMDPQPALLPIGAAGELYVGGAGVSRGYLNRPELTAEKYVWHPDFPRERMYRSGDRVRYLADRDMLYLGRLDHQVQLRGFRIELGEIESQLLKHEEVREAAVIDRQDDRGELYLCAYVVCPEAGSLDLNALKKFLAGGVPDYMIPSHFVRLDRLPLTNNGKLDRTALPEPELSTCWEPAVPGDELEKELSRIWQEVLGRPAASIGIHDNFFDLGGHSLKAAALVSRIHQVFDVRIPLAEVFKTPFIRELSEYIKKKALTNRFVHIGPAEEKEYYPLSYSQRRVYILQQLESRNTHYNLTSIKRIGIVEDVGRVDAVFRRLIDRHESLRTSFHMVAGEPVQRVQSEFEFRVEEVELPAVDGSREKISRSTVTRFIRPFDLTCPPLLRVGLIKLPGKEKPADQADDRYIFILDMHHIITDGISMEIIQREFLALYRGQSLSPPRFRYRDFSQWQNSRSYRSSLQRLERYWLSRFEGEVPVLELPGDFTRPPQRSFEGRTLSFNIAEEEMSQLRSLMQQTGTTLFMILLAVFYVFLSRLSGQEDVVIGVPVAGRGHADLENIVGMFVNSLALRSFPAGEKKFADFLAEVKEQVLSAFENQDYPFEALADKVTGVKDASRNPMFDVMFTLQSGEKGAASHRAGEPGSAGFPDIRPYEYEYHISKFDLGLAVVDDGEPLTFYYTYNTRLFKKETSRRNVEYLKMIMASILERPDNRIADIEILPADERVRLTPGVRRSSPEWETERTVQEPFEAAVIRYSDRVALVFDKKQLTYRHLNEAANRLAYYLRERGLGPGRIAALQVGRSPGMVISVWGILKSGGAYVPIDPDYPAGMTHLVLKDSRSPLLLMDEACHANCSPAVCEGNDFETICLSPAELSGFPADDPDNLNHPGDSAYVIYTSGSTGTPKGVIVDHRSVLAYAAASLEEFPLTPYDVRTQQSSLAFDQFVEEVFPLLFSGGRLVILKKYDTVDPDRLKEILIRYNVTVFSTVPAVLKGLNGAAPLPLLRRIIVGGDMLRPGDISHIADRIPVFNFYGPTETTVCAAHHRCPGSDEGIIPIGRPKVNYQVYILDSSDRPVPAGMTGEICITGEGVSRGYLNRPELTARQFVTNPFSPGTRLYRTGDLGRRLPDGNILMSGRKDFQVKIRGFRIEPGEIESRLQKHPGVKEAVVTVNPDGNGDKSLCAYVVPFTLSGSESNPTSLAEGLKDYLAGELPRHMTPAYFTILERLPLTTQGKVNRRGLPAPVIGSRKEGAGDVPPMTDKERELAAVWQRILKLERVSIDDRFFDCGGNSLNVMALIAGIHQETGIQLRVTDIFDKQTIRLLADSMKDQEKNSFSPLTPVEEREYYPASSLQRRFFILSRMEGITTAYNMPETNILDGEVDSAHLEEIFNSLVRRHDGLRTSFEWIEEDLVQRVHRQVEFKMEYCCSNLPAKDILDRFVRPFDLSRPPLLRAVLVKLAEKKYLLVYDVHHIIVDGISLFILAQEFSRLQKGESLPPLNLQYRDFCHWQHSRLAADEWQDQAEYWLECFKGEIPQLNLPTDYPRPEVQNFTGDVVRFTLDSDVTDRVKNLMRESGTTLYMVFLACYNVLLSRYSGQGDIVVGSPVAGRRHADLRGVIGLFMNVMALRNYPEGGKRFDEFLEEVKENTLAALENQDYPFGELLDKLDIKKELGRSPLFSAEFLMQNMERPESGAAHRNIDGYELELTTAQADVSLVVLDLPVETRCSFIYCSRLFKRETMERFSVHFIKIMDAVSLNSHCRLKDIEMLSETEIAGLENRNNGDSESIPSAGREEKELQADFAF